MTDYERNIFEGKCPYTEKPCDFTIPCNKCAINEEERTLYDDEEGEQE